MTDQLQQRQTSIFPDLIFTKMMPHKPSVFKDITRVSARMIAAAIPLVAAQAQDSLNVPGEPEIQHLTFTPHGSAEGASLSPYGFLRLDAGRKMMFSDGTPHSSSTTWRSSRAGANAVFPQPAGGLKLTGRIECDFLAGTEARPDPRLRHAYLTGETESGWSLLAGQTYDAWYIRDVTMLAYLYPSNRRPQLRLTKTAVLGDGTRLTARLAAVQNRGDYLDPSHADSNRSLAGTLLEPAVIIERSLLTEEPSKLSLGGAYGRERNEFPENPAEDGLYDVGFLMATACIPICHRVVVSGAAYGGENVDTFFLGDLTEGVNPVSGVPIRSLGGWLQGTVRATPKWRFNAGYVWLDPYDEDVGQKGCSRHACHFANTAYRFTPRIQGVAESDFFSKEEIGEDTNTYVRLQLSLYIFF